MGTSVAAFFTFLSPKTGIAEISCHKRLDNPLSCVHNKCIRNTGIEEASCRRHSAVYITVSQFENIIFV